jgi:predicted ATPase
MEMPTKLSTTLQQQHNPMLTNLSARPRASPVEHAHRAFDASLEGERVERPMHRGDPLTTKVVTTAGAEGQHPFGELLAQYRQRKPGLSQRHLAELAGYDQAILVRMAQGKKDLTGPSGRERILRLIETFLDQDVLHTLDEANALLLAANLPPLFERQPAEAKLIARFARMPAGHRVRRTNLPAPLAGFIGRAQEIADVRRLLKTTRLLTLTGSGGVGKTRLAQQVAADVLIAYPDGVWYVELAALREGALIADATVRALGLALTDKPALEHACDFLRERHVLLVLDNCEHLIDAVAEFAIAVLQACPRATILTTSREELNVEGEATWRVPPMQPDEAAQLFVTRAQAARGGASLDEHDTTVAHICQRLDGMPLAIELAASRLQVMSLGDIASKLDDRFTLLAHGRRGALPRHQTLRAMIDWSYELLTERERVVFRRLGVFVGGWEPEQAAEVISDVSPLMDSAPALNKDEALQWMAQLVAKSLIVVEHEDDRTHHRFLETLREYALEKLVQAGELAVLQAKHARAMMQFAEAAETLLRADWHDALRRRIERNFPNVNAALAWSFSPGGDPAVGCHIIGTLHVFWFAQTHSGDLSRWMDAALRAVRDDMPAKTRAGLLFIAASVNEGVRGLDAVLAALRKAQYLYEEAGDMAGAAYCMSQWGGIMVDRDAGNPEGPALVQSAITLARANGAPLIARCSMLSQIYFARMTNHNDEADRLTLALIDECRRVGDKGNLSRALFHSNTPFMETLQFDRAMELLKEAEAVAWDAPDLQTMVFARCTMAEIIRFQGDPARAAEICQEQLRFTLMHLGMGGGFFPKILMAKSLNDLGEHDRARQLARELTQESVDMHILEPTMLYNQMDALACIESGAGNAVKAARLRGIADHCLALCHLRRWGHNEWECAPYMAKARAALGDAAFDTAYAEGYAMPLDQAVAFALGETTKGH